MLHFKYNHHLPAPTEDNVPSRVICRTAADDWTTSPNQPRGGGGRSPAGHRKLVLNAAALLGVIAWRLVEYWLPIPLGAAAYGSLGSGPFRKLSR